MHLPFNRLRRCYSLTVSIFQICKANLAQTLWNTSPFMGPFATAKLTLQIGSRLVHSPCLEPAVLNSSVFVHKFGLSSWFETTELPVGIKGGLVIFAFYEPALSIYTWQLPINFNTWRAFSCWKLPTWYLVVLILSIWIAAWIMLVIV